MFAFWATKKGTMPLLYDVPAAPVITISTDSSFEIPEIIKAADEVGIEWVVVEQDQPSLGLTPIECAKVSIEYLKTL